MIEPEFWRLVGKHNAQVGMEYTLGKREVEALLTDLSEDRRRLLEEVGRARGWGVPKEGK